MDSKPKPESNPDSDQIDGGFMFCMGMAMAVFIAGMIGLVYNIATTFGTAFFN